MKAEGGKKRGKRRVIAVVLCLMVCVGLFLNWFVGCGSQAPLSWNDEGRREAGWLIQDEPARWMTCFYREDLGDLADRLTLKDLCLPSSHDSGAYEVLGFLNKATAPWVVTQDLNLRDQLRAGVRKLDLRVKKISAKEAKRRGIEEGYYIHHGGYLTIPLSKALADLVAFFSSEDGANETLLCEFSHFRDFEEGELGALFDELEEALREHLFVNETGRPLIELPLCEFRGKMIALIDAEMKVSRPGLYELGGKTGLALEGSYANSDEVEKMIADQAKKFSQFDDEGALFSTSWTLTPQYGGLSVPRPVRAMTKEAHAKLVPSFHDEELPFGRLNQGGRIVNLINLDFYGGVNEVVLLLCERVMSQADWARGDQ